MFTFSLLREPAPAGTADAGHASTTASRLKRTRRVIAPMIASALVLSLAACGGGGGGSGGNLPVALGMAAATNPSTSKPADTSTPPSDSTTPPTDTPTTSTHKVTGSVTGLAGSGLVLQNGSEQLAVSQNGSITVALDVPEGFAYNVTVKTQPNGPAQLCTVNGGSGTVGKNDVVDVAVVCSTTSFSVTGMVSGLAGSGLVLQNAGADIAVDKDGLVDLGDTASGGNYAVTVKTQPSNPAQTCSVNNGAGTVSDVAISDVSVICSTNSYSVGGTVTGLKGSGLVLKNNDLDPITVNGDGTFTFPQKIANTARYAVSAAAPVGTSQTCSVDNATGTVGDSDITNVAVKCAANTFTVSGTVSGLDGLGLKLANGATVLPITANGAFSFTVANGASYNVAVRTQPTLVTQDCAVSNGTGSNISADVTGVSVVCTSQRARFAYLTTGSNKVVPYAIGASGQLTAVTPGAANTDMGPTSIVMGATGRQGYVSTASGINQYNVADTGAVTAMNTPKVNAGNMASVLSLDAYNRYVFALNIFDGFPLNGTLGVFSIGSGTGALSSIGEVSTGLVPLALVAEPSGRFVYVGNFGTLQSLGSRITAYKADTLKPIVSTAAGDFVTALTADPTGAFVFALVGNIDPSSITRMTNLSGLATSTLQAFKIQPNGSLKSVNTMSIAGQLATSLVVHPSGRYAYAASTNGKVRRYTVNTTTGELGGAVDTTALSSAVLRITIDPSGKFLFAATANGVTTYAVGLDGTLAPVQTLGSSAVTSMALGL